MKFVYFLDFYDDVEDCARDMQDVHNFSSTKGEDVHVQELPSSGRDSIDSMHPDDSYSNIGSWNPPSVAPPSSAGIGSLVTSEDSSLTTIDNSGHSSSNNTSSGNFTENYSNNCIGYSMPLSLL